MAGFFAVLCVEPGSGAAAPARAAALLSEIERRRVAAPWERSIRAAAGGAACLLVAAGPSAPGSGRAGCVQPPPGDPLVTDLGSALLATTARSFAVAVAGGPTALFDRDLSAAAARGDLAIDGGNPLLPFPHAALATDGMRLAIAGDPLGAWPVYLRRLPHGLAVGTAALPLAQLSPARDLDPCGVAELLAFGQLLGQRTLYADVVALPPGAHAVGDATHTALLPTTLPAHPAGPRSLGAAADRILAALTLAVDQALTPGAAPGLLLSGGLDSRLLLALLASRTSELSALTFGEPGAADLALARRAARVAGATHRFAPWTPDSLARVLAHAVALTDGHVPAVHFHGTDALPALRSAAAAEWNGFAGDAILGGSFAHPRYALPGPLPSRLFTAFNRILRPAELDRVLAPAAAAALARVPAAALRAALARVPPGPPAERARRFLLAERVGRLAAAGLAIDRHYLPVITPYAQAPVLTAMAEMRMAERRFGRALAHTLVRHFPRLAAIPWQRTGAPPGTPWPLAALRRQALALGRRLGRGAERPLADYRAWFAGPLAPLCRRLILSPALRDRACFSPEALARLAADPPRSGREVALRGVLLSVAVAAEILDGTTNPPGELAPPGG